MRKFILILLAVQICSCVGQHGNQEYHQSKVVQDISLNSFNLGVAVTDLSMPSKLPPFLLMHNTCVNFKDSDPISAGTKNSILEYKYNITEQEMLSNFGLDAKLAMSYNGYKGDVIGKIQNINKAIDNKIIYSISRKVFRPIQLTNSYSANEPYQLKDCGTSYISQATAGIYVLANVILEFADNDSKSKLMVEGKLNLGSFADFVASINSLDDNLKNKISVNVELAQFGGDSEKLFSAFSKISQNENPDNSFYLAKLNINEANILFNRIGDYISGHNNVDDFAWQATQYFDNITTYKQLSKLYITPEGVSTKKYQNSVAYVPSGEMKNLLTNHLLQYYNLQDRMLPYTRYVNWVNSHRLTELVEPKNIIDAESNLANANNLFMFMENHGNSCYGEIITQANFSDDCNRILTEDINNAATLVNTVDVNNSKYDSGLKIRTNQSDPFSNDQEYLIYLGKSRLKSQYYFITYSAVPSNAYFANNSYYVFDGDDMINTMQLDSFCYPNFNIQTVPTYSFSLSGVDVYFTSNGLPQKIAFDDIDYMTYNKDSEIAKPEPEPAQKISSPILLTRGIVF